jgi:hypothetical protein
MSTRHYSKTKIGISTNLPTTDKVGEKFRAEIDKPGSQITLSLSKEGDARVDTKYTLAKNNNSSNICSSKDCENTALSTITVEKVKKSKFPVKITLNSKMHVVDKTLLCEVHEKTSDDSSLSVEFRSIFREFTYKFGEGKGSMKIFQEQKIEPLLAKVDEKIAEVRPNREQELIDAQSSLKYL